MRRSGKSQWDFGELFGPAAGRKIVPVSELTASIRRQIEREFGQVWVSGEVSNFRPQPSGHLYFTLKDAGAQLACVLFRGEPAPNRALLRDGAHVVLGGGLTVYEARGQYQLRVTAVELQGVGLLQQEFERLKQKLKAEGLFDPARKRPIPRYPQRIGLVTSPAGAALRDVLHVVQRRQPALELVLAPCRVQGQGAGVEIAAAIGLLNAWHSQGHSLDLILVTRGGGSLEDLWAFNEEVVARAIAASALPVVSGVGHEIDFTISDFVADLRAATPSAAAELITEGVFSSCQYIAEAGRVLSGRVRAALADRREEVGDWIQRLERAHPRRKLQERWQRLDDLQETLRRCARRQWSDHARAAGSLLDRLVRIRPSRAHREQWARWESLVRSLRDRNEQRLRELQRRWSHAAARLRLLSPQQVLERGYSITTDARSGQVLRSAAAIRPGQALRTRLADGTVESQAMVPPAPGIG